ncbi:hypothetical protein [Brachybacterium phenoliresistens]|uniref:hypothetical protein n=1 Tax=Brachybacterium phenoliresistens TaxID=396014 RepID=UPI0031E1B815
MIARFLGITPAAVAGPAGDDQLVRGACTLPRDEVVVGPAAAALLVAPGNDVAAVAAGIPVAETDREDQLEVRGVRLAVSLPLHRLAGAEVEELGILHEPDDLPALLGDDLEEPGALRLVQQDPVSVRRQQDRRAEADLVVVLLLSGLDEQPGHEAEDLVDAALVSIVQLGDGEHSLVRRCIITRP